MAFQNVIDAYPALLPFVEEGDREIFDRELSRPARELSAWVARHTVIRSCNNRNFQALVAPSSEGDGSAIVTSTEFGSGLWTPDRTLPHSSIAVAKMMRDILSPASAVVVLTNNGFRERNNLNFSTKERWSMFKGDRSPTTERLLRATDGFDGVITYGASQAANTTMAFAAHQDVRVIASGAFESPTVVGRNYGKLITDFNGSAAHIKENIDLLISPGPHDNQPYPEAYRAVFTPENDKRYIAGMLQLDNIFSAAPLNRPTFVGDASTILEKGGGFVHIWSENENVSPDDANVAAMKMLRAYRDYLPLRLEGLLADHGAITALPIAVLGMRKVLNNRSD